MSVQVAMMAGTAALTAFSAIQKGQAEGQALEGQAGGMRLQAAGTDVEASETKAAAMNEEYQRRAGVDRLLAANRGDISSKNISGEQGTSFDVIQDYNKSQSDRDVGNVRFMAESRTRRLSFAKASYENQASQYMNMASMARTAGWINAGVGLAKMGMSYFGMPKFGGGGGGTAAAGSGAAP